MIIFRKIKLEDLDVIYNDQILRPLLTAEAPDPGQRFGMVIERDKCIVGGVCGYRLYGRAFINCVIIKNSREEAVLLDGLIRSLIHVLDREGVKELYAVDDKYRKNSWRSCM